MKVSLLQLWINFLTLLPGTVLTLLTIAVAFLRFYDEQDFTILGQITDPRLWSNRLTVGALLVAVVNFGIEEERPRGGFLRKGTRDDWNRRNRATNRLAEAREQEAEARERTARRARIQNRWYVLQIRHQLEANESTRRALTDFLSFLQEYQE